MLFPAFWRADGWSWTFSCGQLNFPQPFWHLQINVKLNEGLKKGDRNSAALKIYQTQNSAIQVRQVYTSVCDYKPVWKTKWLL